MIDKKVTCVAKNYHVDEETQQENKDKSKPQTKNIDFPREFPQPIYLSTKIPQNDKTNFDSEIDSQNESTFDEKSLLKKRR